MGTSLFTFKNESSSLTSSEITATGKRKPESRKITGVGIWSYGGCRVGDLSFVSINI